MSGRKNEMDPSVLDRFLPRLSEWPAELQPVLWSWLESTAAELWQTTADIPKPDVRLHSLELMLARRLDKARTLGRVLERHGLTDHQELLLDLLHSLL